MRKVAITLLGDTEDASADFVEVAFSDVKTPPTGSPIGLVVSRYHSSDRWLTPSGWSPQPPTEQLPLAVVSRPGSSPVVLKLPLSWTRYVDPFERISMSCTALDAEGTLAWHYTGVEFPVDRADNRPAPIELPPEPVPPPVPPPAAPPEPPPVITTVEPPADEEEPEPEKPGPTVIIDPPEEETKKRLPWALVAGALILLIGAPAAFFLMSGEKQPDDPSVVTATPPAMTADEMAAKARDEHAADNCDEARQFARDADQGQSADGALLMGQANDPSWPEFKLCIVNNWSAINALGYYEKACNRNSPDAPDNARRLLDWIKEKSADPSMVNQIGPVTYLIADLQAACKLQ